MGIYIYGIRSPKHVAKVKLEDGTVMTVAKYAYAYKPLWGFFGKWNPEPRWQVLARARLVRLEKIWDKYIATGGTWPQGGVMVHGDGDNSISPGTTVMRWSRDNWLPTSIEDCTCNKATFVGKVVEVL